MSQTFSIKVNAKDKATILLWYGLLVLLGLCVDYLECVIKILFQKFGGDLHFHIVPSNAITFVT